MNYQESIQWLADRQDRGIRPGLEIMQALLARIGDPQKQVQTVVVAGTNGKGSLCAMLSAVLEEAGCRAGTYTSPAVFDRLEQYRLGTSPCTEAQFAQACTLVRRGAEALAAEGVFPTGFELETAAAFALFAQQHCEIAVLECGMGGDLDAVNVAEHRILTVMMPIAMDHTRFLGDTLEEIARHKAGIITAGCPLVTAPQQPQVLDVLQDACAAAGSPCIVVPDTMLTILEDTPYSMRLQEASTGEGWQLGLHGSYQRVNASVALEACRQLAKAGLPIFRETIRRGLAKTRHPGRFQVLGHAPVFVLDGAHNPHGMEAFCTGLEHLFPGRERLAVMGVFRDKDFERMLQRLSRTATGLYAVTAPGSRGLDAGVLGKAAEQYFPRVWVCPDPAEAIRQAAEHREAVIPVCGSLSFLAQAGAEIRRVQGK